MSAPRGSPSPSRASTVKPGGNWKALKKTLDADSPIGETGRRRAIKHRRPSTSDSTRDERPYPPSAIHKGKARAIDRGDSSRLSSANSSPAPTSLPWFAEDLSPEDLALVRGGRSNDRRRASTDEDRRKKQTILGGSSISGITEAQKEPGQYIAIDCEMVGVGYKGSESILARVSIVNWHGHVLLDRFVKPMEKVTDYRTWVSGVRASDLSGAPSFREVQDEVATLIKGRVLVGHAIQNDLKALLLDHPRPLIRDTATFQPLRDLAQTKFPGLKKLAKLVLGLDIQKDGDEHSSVEDARTTMAIFRTQKDAWEKSIKSFGEKQRKKNSGRVGFGQASQQDLPEAAQIEGESIEKAITGRAGGRVWQPPPRKKTQSQARPGWWKEDDNTGGDWSGDPQD